MTRTTVNGKDILVVWFPERISPTIADNRVVGWKSGYVKYYSEELPVGQWEIVLDTAEDDYATLMPIISGWSRSLYYNYEADQRDYRDIIEAAFDTPKASFHSLLRSLNLPTDKRYIVLQNKQS